MCNRSPRQSRDVRKEKENTIGLYVHNLGHLPADDTRRYFVYVLDYGWHEPLTDTLIANFRNMARLASETKSVVVAGIEPIHFANEVFSWHGINGEEGESILPALMVTTLHPRYFLEHNRDADCAEVKDTLLLIPLKKTCKTTDEVVELIKSVFDDIKKNNRLSKFKVAKIIKRDRARRLADAVIAEPSVCGVGVDLKKLFAALQPGTRVG